MNITSFTLLLIFTLIHANSGTISVENNPEKCNPQVKSQYMAFYKQNFAQNDLLVSDDLASKQKCYFQIFRVDSVLTTLAWIDLASLNLPGISNFIISQVDVSSGWKVEENMEIPVLTGSYNETLIKEKSGELDRAQRMTNFFAPIIQNTLNKFEVSKKKEYYEILYFMNKMGFDVLQEFWYCDFFAVYIEILEPYLFQNFKKDFTAAVVEKGLHVIQFLTNLFQTVLNRDIAKKTFDHVSTDVNYVEAKFKEIVEIMATHLSESNENVGRNYLSVAMNLEMTSITKDELYYFISGFIRTVDKTKKEGFVFKLPDLEEGAEARTDQEEIEMLLNIMRSLDPYRIQFYLLEKFELVGLERARKNGMSFNFMSRTPADNCGLTDNNINSFIDLAITQKVLDSSTFSSQTQKDMFVRCEKIVDQNTEFFKLILKPDNNQECEVVIKRENDQIIVLLDTFVQYGSKVSCMRYTRGILAVNKFLMIL